MNGIVAIDKPHGWTSHDVVAKLRRILNERRIGHSGTLDPMATGVLLVFVGRATRAVEFAEADEKEYIASAKLGIETDTQDVTGNTVASCADFSVSEQQIKEALELFHGEIKQVPPMYSAIKIGGKKLYEIARSGKTVEREARKITVREIELLGFSGDEINFRVVCSKGTYIRTLASNIGSRLGCGAALSSLRRTRVGSVVIEDCISLEQTAEAVKRGQTESILKPVDSLFLQYPEIGINRDMEKKCRNGNDFQIKDCADGEYRVYAEDGGFLMLGRCEKNVMHTVKSFFEP